MCDNLFELEVSSFLIVLVGAIGYWLASGAERANYKVLHVAIGVSLFFMITLYVNQFLEKYFDPIFTLIISIVAVSVIAIVWRRWLAERAFLLLRRLGVTITPFGPSETWDIITSVPGSTFYSYYVELEDETVLISNTEELVKIKNLNCPPEIITDEKGNIALLVTEIRKKGKNPIKNTPFNGITKRTEYTYIPSSNVKMIKTYFDVKNCCI